MTTVARAKPRAAKKPAKQSAPAPVAVVVPVAPVRLNIGGKDERDGWTLIDRKVGKEAYPLGDYADGSVDEVYASHILEHFGSRESQDVLNEWVRVLKPGGRIRVAVPDFRWCCQNYLADRPDMYGSYIMGGQTGPDDFHHALFDEAGLRLMMQRAGLFGIGPWKSEWDDCASMPVSLNLEGYKPHPMVNESGFKRKCAAVMSLGRLGFTATFASTVRTLVQLRMPYIQVDGCWWHQCLDRAITDHVLDSDLEWIVTIDGDSLFNTDTLVRLATVFENHPELDALASAQVGREGGGLLMNTGGVEVSLDADVVPAKSAHFGLTFFKVEALRKVPRPWFREEPAPNGTYGEGRVDADISFWNQFEKAGLKLGVAPRVPIGHLELMATWIGEGMVPLYQHIKDWNENGVPVDARR